MTIIPPYSSNINKQELQLIQQGIADDTNSLPSRFKVVENAKRKV